MVVSKDGTGTWLSGRAAVGLFTRVFRTNGAVSTGGGCRCGNSPALLLCPSHVSGQMFLSLYLSKVNFTVLQHEQEPRNGSQDVTRGDMLLAVEMCITPETHNHKQNTGRSWCA